MNAPTLLALIEAGQIKSEDDTFGLIQNIDYETACGIADWLAIATGARVHLRFMSFGGTADIERRPEDVKITRTGPT